MVEVKKWTEFRKEIHAGPELSGYEEETSEKVCRALKELSPDELYRDVGGYGVMATFFGKKPSYSENLLFRAELDAIAVQEESGVNYTSEKNGVMHGCGHDGHMAILMGLAEHLSQHPPQKVNVSLLFQPAEETGRGASRVIQDPIFKKKEFKRAYALHNLPGFNENQVIIKKEVFAAASTGLEIVVNGRSSHAAYPEQGSNPSQLLGRLLTYISEDFEDFKRAGVVNKIVCTYAQMGNVAYGISPGRAQMGITIRSAEDELLKKTVDRVRERVDVESRLFDGEVTIKQIEPFSATVNDSTGTEFVKSVAEHNGLSVNEMDIPFAWSEDFGEFRKKCPITLFGLGSGKNHPPLHSETYDFNDKLIETGINMFVGLISL
jgi:amidohydrolase